LFLDHKHGFTPRDIAIAIAGSGIMGAFVQFFLCPVSEKGSKSRRGSPTERLPRIISVTCNPKKGFAGLFFEFIRKK